LTLKDNEALNTRHHPGGLFPGFNKFYIPNTSFITSNQLHSIGANVRTCCIGNIEFIEAWEESTRMMPGIESFVVFESPTGGPPGRDIDIRIVSDDLQTIKKAALALRNNSDHYLDLLLLKTIYHSENKKYC
jgi:hypothetical protein